MKARDVMETQIVEAYSSDTLRAGCKLMEQHGVRHLVIRDDSGHLAGIVSDRDLRLCQPSRVWRRRGEVEFGLDAMRLAIAMTAGEIVTVEPESDLAVVASRMLDNFVSALPVVVGPDIVGIVTATDLLEVIAGRRHPATDDEDG